MKDTPNTRRERPKHTSNASIDEIYTADYAKMAERILEGEVTEQGSSPLANTLRTSSEGMIISPEGFTEEEATLQLQRFIDQFEPDPNNEGSFLDISLYEVVYDDQLQSYVILYDSAPLPTLMLENGNYPELFIPPAMLSLKMLSVRSCNIEQLIGLPRSLTHLYCSDNKLSQLPELPSLIEVLYCDANQLTILPEIPQTLKEINVNNNPLDEQTLDILKQRGFLQ